jgi:hypothetical protein
MANFQQTIGLIVSQGKWVGALLLAFVGFDWLIRHRRIFAIVPEKTVYEYTAIFS